MLRVVVSAPRGNALHAVCRGDEQLLDLCDELWILVWEENHARGLSLEQMQNPRFEAQAEQVIRSPYGAKWSEEYQAKALGAQLEAVLGAEDCAGVYLWQFCDIRVSDEWWGVRPRTMNNKGVFDEYRRLKLCAEVVKKIFRET